MSAVALAHLRPGEAAHIAALDPAHPLRRRLLELGFVRGARVEIVRRAPMGDPVQLHLNGTHLALRAADLHGIHVMRTPQESGASPTAPQHAGRP